jgi:virulence factor Mce-like protein
VNTLAPQTSRIAAMVTFAGTCVALLLFLWLSFGGTIPLQPQGYRFTVEFPDAVQLGTQADVRIAGVNVGKVVSVAADPSTGLTRAVLEIDPAFAPRPDDTRAILRQKSLLGETYVELSFGNPRGPMLPDGGRLPEGQVAPTVQLDQILSTFDPITRRAFQVWITQTGIALTARGQDFNDAVAQLYPFATNVESVLTVLRRDQSETSVLLHDGGVVFSAIGASPAHLQGLIRNADTVFAATAAGHRELAAAVRALPSFLIATRRTIARLYRFAGATQPLIDELRPAAVQLSPALVSIDRLAPVLRELMVAIGPLNAAAAAGEPAVERFLNVSVPLLARLKPYLGGLVPVINYINSYRREVAAFFANSTAASQATSQSFTSSLLKHYVRLSAPVNPETLTAYPARPYSNRSNPYLQPGGYNDLLIGLPVFGAYLCTNNALPTIGPTVPANLASILRAVYYTANPAGPPCRAQAPLGETITGLTQTFPHLKPLP